jgi:vitamin-K-epoxide reductase (warfarin-sensitive)
MFGLDRHFLSFVLPILVIQCFIWKCAYDADPRGQQAILGFWGLWWCLAALWVEVKIEQKYPGFQYDNVPDKEMGKYKPFCDFASWATCSVVLMSPPGRMLRYFGIAKQADKHQASTDIFTIIRNFIDVPNPALGVLFFGCHAFYPLLLVVPFVNSYMSYLFFGACCFVGIMTIWLAYNLFFVLKDFCVVCVSMYVANFAVIKTMWSISQMHRDTLGQFGSLDPNDTRAFFGDADYKLIGPIFIIDAIMFVAVVALYFFGEHETHARSITVDDHYIHLNA